MYFLEGSPMGEMALDRMRRLLYLSNQDSYRAIQRNSWLSKLSHAQQAWHPRSHTSTPRYPRALTRTASSESGVALLPRLTSGGTHTHARLSMFTVDHVVSRSGRRMELLLKR